MSSAIPASNPSPHARAKITIRVRTNTAYAARPFKIVMITFPINVTMAEIPFPIELKRTPKSISSFCGVFFGEAVLIWFNYIVLKRNAKVFIL